MGVNTNWTKTGPETFGAKPYLEKFRLVFVSTAKKTLLMPIGHAKKTLSIWSCAKRTIVHLVLSLWQEQLLPIIPCTFGKCPFGGAVELRSCQKDNVQLDTPAKKTKSCQLDNLYFLKCTLCTECPPGGAINGMSCQKYFCSYQVMPIVHLALRGIPIVHN